MKIRFSCMKKTFSCTEISTFHAWKWNFQATIFFIHETFRMGVNQSSGRSQNTGWLVYELNFVTVDAQIAFYKLFCIVSSQNSGCTCAAGLTGGQYRPNYRWASGEGASSDGEGAHRGRRWYTGQGASRPTWWIYRHSLGKYSGIKVSVCSTSFNREHVFPLWNVRRYMHTYIHTNVHAYIHTYMHACTHTHTWNRFSLFCLIAYIYIWFIEKCLFT